jgi:hypothetical protein
VPQLRIVDDALCERVKARQEMLAFRTRTVALRNQRFAGNQSQFPTSPTTPLTPLATDH